MQGKNSNVSKKNIINYYDHYVDRQKSVGVNQRHYSILKKLMQEGLKSNHNVLEIGCGIGTLSSILIEKLRNGSLVSIDIGGKNIDEAKKRLGNIENIKLIHADVSEHDFNSQVFDVIVMPDVLEHIPVDNHFELFRKLSSIIAPFGFVFIHIPNPFYLEWCHSFHPELLQIIDQPIHTNLLIENTIPHGLFISKLETYSVWVADGDYQYIVLRKRGYEDFNRRFYNQENLLDKIIRKLKKFKM